MITKRQTHLVGDAVVTRIQELILRDFKTTDLIPEWDATIGESTTNGWCPSAWMPRTSMW